MSYIYPSSYDFDMDLSVSPLRDHSLLQYQILSEAICSHNPKAD